MFCISVWKDRRMRLTAKFVMMALCFDMAEKNYLVLTDLDTRKRHYHFVEAGRIIKFPVQLEVKVGDTSK